MGIKNFEFNQFDAGVLQGDFINRNDLGKKNSIQSGWRPLLEIVGHKKNYAKTQLFCMY